MEGKEARRWSQRRWLAVGAAAATALLTAGAVGITSSAMSGQDETIQACVHSVTGKVRIDDTCRAKEQPLSWPGAPSANVLLTRVDVSRTITVPPSSDPTVDPVVDVSVRCPDGMVAVAGGYPLAYGIAEVKLEEWYSAPSHDAQRWNKGWINRTDQPVTAKIEYSAFCTPGAVSSSD
jgi:hypothetical protein